MSEITTISKVESVEDCELERCPFCKGKSFFNYDKNGYCWFECDSCGARGAVGDHLTAYEWRNRPIEDELRERIAELEKDKAVLISLLENWKAWAMRRRFEIKKYIAEIREKDKVIDAIMEVLK